MTTNSDNNKNTKAALAQLLKKMALCIALVKFGQGAAAAELSAEVATDLADLFIDGAGKPDAEPKLPLDKPK